MGRKVEYITARICGMQCVTDELRRLWLDLGEDREFNFKPGQYCTLSLRGIERAYSIVSGPHERFLELFIELVPDGELTPKIWQLKIGNYIQVRPRAKGIFTMDERVHHHFMLATVTGVVPYVSMLRDCIHRKINGHKLYVVFGASYQDELAYAQHLSGLAARHLELIEFVPTISRPHEERNDGWLGETGRVNLIAEQHLAKFNPPQNDTMIYACGHPEMIEDVRARFLPKGWKVKEERFWK